MGRRDRRDQGGNAVPFCAPVLDHSGAQEPFAKDHADISGEDLVEIWQDVWSQDLHIHVRQQGGQAVQFPLTIRLHRERSRFDVEFGFGIVGILKQGGASHVTGGSHNHALERVPFVGGLQLHPASPYFVSKCSRLWRMSSNIVALSIISAAN